MIPDTDVWYARFVKFARQIAGIDLSRDEFRSNYVGKDPFGKVTELSDNPEADKREQAFVAAQNAAEQNGKIAEARYQQEKRVADLVGVTNPDDTDAIVTVINTLKTNSGNFEEITGPVFKKKG